MRPAQRALKNPLPQLLSWERGQFSLCLASYNYRAFPSHPGCRPASPGPQGTRSPPQLTVGLVWYDLGALARISGSGGRPPPHSGLDNPEASGVPASLEVSAGYPTTLGREWMRPRAGPGHSRPLSFRVGLSVPRCSPWGRTWPTLSSIGLFVEDRPREVQ